MSSGSSSSSTPAASPLWSAHDGSAFGGRRPGPGRACAFVHPRSPLLRSVGDGLRHRSVNRRPIPEATVGRLPVYLRGLVEMAERGTTTVSSEHLAEAAGVNSAKVRRDAGSGLRRGLLDPPGAPRTGPDPGLAGADRRCGEPGPRLDELPWVRPSRVPDRGAGGRG